MDTSQYLSMFLEESSDNLQLLNESLLILENNSEDMEILNQIFRVAHTIKGMAATMGYIKMAELTHKMEDVLSKFREGQLKVTHEVVTILFNCLDVLESMVSDIAAGGDADLEVDDIVTQLVNIANGDKNIEDEEEKSSDAIVNEKAVELGIDEYDIDILKEAVKNDFNTFHIHIGLDEKTVLKSARVFTLFQKLEEYGEILKSNPNLEDLEIENFDFDIDLIFVTESSLETISNVVNSISEIRQVEVTDIRNVITDSNTNSEEVVNEKAIELGLDEYDIDILKEAIKNDFNTVHIHIGLDEKTVLKSARVFTLFQKLEEYGEILKSNPSLEDLEAENFDFDIDLIFVTKSSLEIISNAVNSISEIRQVEATDIRNVVTNSNTNSEEVVNEKAIELGLDEYDIDILKEAAKNDFNTFHIHIGLDERTVLKSARVFTLFQKLEEHGEILKSDPNLEDLEVENFDFDIDLIFVTKSSLETISNVVNSISEIRQVEVTDIRNVVTNDNINSEEIVNEKAVELGIDEYDTDILKEAIKNGFNTFHIHIGLDEKTVLKSARVFTLFQKLEEYGEILKSDPKLEDLEIENFDFDIDLIFVTESSLETISNVVNSISEIRQVEVIDISGIVKVGNMNKENSASGKVEESNKNEIAATRVADSTLEKNSTESIRNKESSSKVVDLKESKNNLKAKTVETSPKTEEANKKQPVRPKNKGVGQSVRVDLERLDNFMNMVSELVIHRTRLEQISANYKIVELNETLEQVARTTTDLQDLVMKIRMLPLDVVFNRFPRMIRDLSMELNKEIDFEIQGQDTELDRTVIEEIGEPLIHLLRNAADHGVESVEKRISQGKSASGKIKLIAYSEGTKAVIKVEDDGSGINVEKVKAKAEKVGINTEGMSDSDVKNLIFAQGFSTNEVVTDISGRGVGMDVVKTKISSLGGTVDVFSEEGKGTSFIIKLPLTLQIIQSLLVKIGTETMAISLGFIDRVMEYKSEDIRKSNNKEIVVYNEKIFKLVRINDKLDIESKDYGKKYIILAKVGENEVALVVDSLLGQKEIVIKPFGNILKSTKEYIGATILGDGLVTLILDVAALI
jgi:two-component system chemotaxis sensor kinase CheA